MTTFWSWLFRGNGNSSGLRRFVDWWLLLHLAVGVAMPLLLPISLKDAATSLLLPISGIFIGLSFAWGGNAQALLQSAEVEAVAEYKEGGYEDYVYQFQSAILMILVTLALWGIAGLGIFDMVWPACQSDWKYKSIAGILFLFSSMTLRECWHVVLGAHNLLLVRFQIRKGNRGR